MRRPTFWQVCTGWLVLVMLAWGLNGLTVRSGLLQRCVMASLGAFLLVRPVWPKVFGVYYDDKTCRCLMRICGAVEVISSLAVRSFF